MSMFLKIDVLYKIIGVNNIHFLKLVVFNIDVLYSMLLRGYLLNFIKIL